MNSITCSEAEFRDAAILLKGNDSALTHVGWIMPQEGDFGFYREQRCVWYIHNNMISNLLGYVEE